MSATRPRTGHIAAESEQDRQTRLAWEAEMLAVAEQQIAAGLGLRGSQLDAWLAAFEGEGDLPSAQPVR